MAGISIFKNTNSSYSQHWGTKLATEVPGREGRGRGGTEAELGNTFRTVCCSRGAGLWVGRQAHPLHSTDQSTCHPPSAHRPAAPSYPSSPPGTLFVSWDEESLTVCRPPCFHLVSFSLRSPVILCLCFSDSSQQWHMVIYSGLCACRIRLQCDQVPNKAQMKKGYQTIF